MITCWLVIIFQLPLCPGSFVQFCDAVIRLKTFARLENSKLPIISLHVGCLICQSLYMGNLYIVSQSCVFLKLNRCFLY
uniref:Secreted protein n=1 Tax=Anguilla anguilla TaxID=7936 RepID=A0A0E9X506_ANGAN